MRLRGVPAGGTAPRVDDRRLRRRQTADLIGSGLLLLALASATIATLAPTVGASVAPSGASLVATDPAVERGRMLFYAKGCVACHRMAGISEGVGAPDLTRLHEHAGSRRPGLSAIAYVRESLRTPAAFIAPGWNGDRAMPDLGLTDAEIEALAAFLLAPDK